MPSIKHAVLHVYFLMCVLSLVVILVCVYRSVKDNSLAAVELKTEHNRIRSYAWTRESAQETVSDVVDQQITRCMHSANLDDVLPDFPSLMKNARRNAQYMYHELRRVIPKSPLKEYRSYCWNEEFSVHWGKTKFKGRIGNNITFNGVIDDLELPGRSVSYLNKLLPQHSFDSNTICIPKVFIAGFPKCGSTFTHCLVSKFISMATYGPKQPQTSLKKEPHFWALSNSVKKHYAPTVSSFGRYLFYFLPGLQQISREMQRSDVVLLDSTVNKLFMWPRFEKSQYDLTNYCILPSVLPELLPGSKFIVVVRNPVSMLYSAFWNSCSRLYKNIPISTQLKGPGLFHDRVMTKIQLFNNCMRNGSIAAISKPCELDSEGDYTSCILHPQRLRLLEKCINNITFNYYTPELPNCGRSRIAMGLYYVHIKKWLSVVPKEQFRFLVLEDLVRDTEQSMLDLLTFLNINMTGPLDKIDTCGTNPQTSVDYKHDSRLRMRKDTKRLLEIFYRPFNALLAQLANKPSILHWFDK